MFRIFILAKVWFNLANWDFLADFPTLLRVFKMLNPIWSGARNLLSIHVPKLRYSPPALKGFKIEGEWGPFVRSAVLLPLPTIIMMIIMWWREMHDSWLLLSCSTDIFFGDREALNSPHASELLTPAEMEAAGEEKESILLRDGRINKAAPAIISI